MNRLWLYNPENDIALGFGGANFTAPKNARLLSDFAAPLMWWMGTPDDGVLVERMADSAYRRVLMDWAAEMERRFGPGPALIRDARELSVRECAPWGWSRHALRRFASAGVPEHVMEYAAANIDRIRQLSHRRSSAELTRRITEAVDFPSFGLPEPSLPREACSFEEIVGISAEFPDGIYVKSPWSSSGRGVAYIAPGELPRQRSRIEGTIKSQGSVMVERAYDNLLDFAMLFCSDGSEVSFLGYSRFYNSRGTAYSGNLVASDADILRELTAFLPAPLFAALERALPGILTDFLRLPGSGRLAYRGFLGLDMMIARSAASAPVMLVPCVELNLRKTMGTVAHLLYRRLLASGLLPASRALLSMSAGTVTGSLTSSDGIPLIPENPFFCINLTEG